MAASTDFTTQHGVKNAYDPQTGSKVAVLKSVLINVSSATAADTVNITLKDYGITEVEAVEYGYFSTADSVYVSVPVVTTVVTTGVLTVTLPAGSAAQASSIRIFYK